MSTNPLEQAILSYFRNPDPAALADLFAATPVDENWRAQLVLTLPVFLALVMDAAPHIAGTLVEAHRGGDPAKIEVVAQALNYSHHGDRRRLMEKLVGERAAGAMDEAGADFKDFTPSHPVHVDMLWAAFFATGDVDYLTGIARLLSGWLPQSQLEPLVAAAAKDAAVQEKAMAGVLANTAFVTLSVNARDIAEVKAALYAQAERKDGMASALAAKILAGV